MKSLPIKNLIHKRIIQNISSWLETLGYSEGVICGAPSHVRELCYWLEQQDLTLTETTNIKVYERYIEYLKNRPNKRRSGGIGISHINKQIDAINKLFRYLKHNGIFKNELVLTQEKEDINRLPTILTIEEVKALYDATDNSIVGIRDKAILSVIYACGLRRSEAINLTIDDVDFTTKKLHVRKTKNNHERFVPIATKPLQHLEHYITYAHSLLCNSSTPKLFISNYGKPLKGGSLLTRLKVLQQNSNHEPLKQKQINLHSLRHSIATHLLHDGLSFEKVGLFLGHKCLDSTQIYTHLIHKNQVL